MKLSESGLLNTAYHNFVFKGGRKNPFVVPPSYHHWSPWIGPQTRRSNVVLNTEFEKIQTPKMTHDSDDLQMTEERLADELLNLKVNSDREITLRNTSLCTDKVCLTAALSYKCICR